MFRCSRYYILCKLLGLPTSIVSNITTQPITYNVLYFFGIELCPSLNHSLISFAVTFVELCLYLLDIDLKSHELLGADLVIWKASELIFLAIQTLYLQLFLTQSTITNDLLDLFMVNSKPYLIATRFSLVTVSSLFRNWYHYENLNHQKNITMMCSNRCML